MPMIDAYPAIAKSGSKEDKERLAKEIARAAMETSNPKEIRICAERMAGLGFEKTGEVLYAKATKLAEETAKRASVLEQHAKKTQNPVHWEAYAALVESIGDDRRAKAARLLAQKIRSEAQA